MKLRQLEFLVALDKYSTISSVAQKLYTSQPAISVAIRELETELGYTLLLRSNRGTEFTEQGKLVLEQAKKIMSCVDAIQGISSYCEDNLVGRVQVAALPHLCNTIFSDIQMKLISQYPDFHLDIAGMETEDVFHAVESGKMRIGIIQTAELIHVGFEKAVNSGKVSYSSLFSDPMSFVVADGHPLLKKDHVTVKDLAPYPFAVYGDGVNEFVLGLLQSVGYPDAIRRFYEVVRMRKYMRSFEGVTVLPHKAVTYSNEIYQIKYRILDVEGVRWNTEVGLIYKEDGQSDAERYIIREIMRSAGIQ